MKNPCATGSVFLKEIAMFNLDEFLATHHAHDQRSRVLRAVNEPVGVGQHVGESTFGFVGR